MLPNFLNNIVVRTAIVFYVLTSLIGYRSKEEKEGYQLTVKWKFQNKYFK